MKNHPSEAAPIRVVVVDDSALMRQLISRILNDAPDIEVVDTAADAQTARQSIKTHNPDVVTLDIEMPKMDGLSFLEKIMTLRPMPVVMVSSLTQDGAEATVRALELGAVDVVGKPQGDLRNGMAALGGVLVEKVRAAAGAQVKPLERSRAGGNGGGARLHALPRIEGTGAGLRVVAIGASTGGVEALREVICALPPDMPGILVVQHMPGGFTRSFADRLDGLCDLTVCEAVDGAPVKPGHVYIAPGTHHLTLDQAGGSDICRLSENDPVNGHRPSVDVLFDSVAQTAGAAALGVILTGMGKDGARGLLRLRRKGARTLGQDAASCVVYGMPRVAEELGAVEAQLNLKDIAGAIRARVVGEAVGGHA
mgnify:CR=1 FL=1